MSWRGHVAWDGHFSLDAQVDEIEQLGQVTRRRFTIRGDPRPSS